MTQLGMQRGLTYFKIKVSGPARDLHSGVFGRTVHEPMTDLIQLMSKLVTPQGDILIPGVEDLVAPLTESEKYVLILESCISCYILYRARYDRLDYGVSVRIWCTFLP